MDILPENIPDSTIAEVDEMTKTNDEINIELSTHISDSFEEGTKPSREKMNDVITDFIKNTVYNASLKDCDLDNNKRALEIYTYYQSLRAAMKTKNKVKINMYKEKLAKLCNAEYCESC